MRKPVILAALLLIPSAALLWIQQQELAQQRQEGRTLTERRHALLQQGSSASPLPASEEITSLAQSNQPLAALRSQIVELRRQKKELDPLRQQVADLRAQKEREGGRFRSIAQQPGFVPTEQWRDAGLGSPEASLTTFFWAMREGNLQRLSEIVPASAVPPAPPPTISEDFRKWVTGYRLIEKEVVNESEVTLRVGLFDEETEIRFRREGEKWLLKP